MENVSFESQFLPDFQTPLPRFEKTKEDFSPTPGLGQKEKKALLAVEE